MRRSKEQFVETKSFEDHKNVSGCLDFHGEDLSIIIKFKKSNQENSILKINKNKFYYNKLMKKTKLSNQINKIIKRNSKKSKIITTCLKNI